MILFRIREPAKPDGILIGERKDISTDMEKLLSVVLPAFNEEGMLEITSDTLVDLLTAENIPYELVFVDDGSRDRTWEMIAEAAEKNPHIHGVRFSRNFGKEAAIFAGLACAQGDCAAVMDCDLQHPPASLIEMYRFWEEGYQVVEGVKQSRGEESVFHRKSASLFYRSMSRITGINMAGASDFKLLDRTVVDALLSMPERNVFFRALSSWVGFRKIEVEYDVQERAAGESKWSTRSLIRYAVNNIAGFTTFPMQMVTWAGVGTLIFAVILGVQTLVKWFLGHSVEGFTTVILLILLIGSVIMISLGIIGFYLARIYQEIQGRPRYIISKKI